MILDVPNDLSGLSPRDLDALEEQLSSAIVNIRVHRRSPGGTSDELAGRPEWAKRLYRLVDDKRSRTGIVLVVLAFFALPTLAESCGAAVAQFQQTKRAMDSAPYMRNR